VRVRLSFAFDGECPPGVKEEYAIHLIDGFLQIRDGNGVFVTDEHVPLLELALWLSDWLASRSAPTERVFCFFPNSFTAALFRLAPLDRSRYQLAYLADEECETTSYLIAEEADFQRAFTDFISTLAHALQQHYHIHLENIFRQFLTPAPQQHRIVRSATSSSFFYWLLGKVE
jgi:hypothetical protein